MWFLSGNPQKSYRYLESNHPRNNWSKLQTDCIILSNILRQCTRRYGENSQSHLKIVRIHVQNIRKQTKTFSCSRRMLNSAEPWFLCVQLSFSQLQDPSWAELKDWGEGLGPPPGPSCSPVLTEKTPCRIASPSSHAHNQECLWV